LGKTTFATCIPRDLGVSLQIASGAALAAPKDLMPYLTNAEKDSVLFIDEIHRLPKAVEEFMYPALEDFRIDVVLGEGAGARTVNYKLNPFTVIGATTRSGLLSAPLRDRFQIREHLEFYSVEELTEIVRRNAGKLRVEIEDAAAEKVAHSSRGTPRIANNRLRWVRDYSTSKARGQITLAVAEAALAMLGIDVLGLDAQDRKYLETIARVFHGGPAGVEAIAHTMNAALDTLVDEVEPFLLRSELVVRTPRGRKLTSTAYKHLGTTPPKGEAEMPLFG
jgi:Holliday junction DNA helicase RuvB